MVEDIRIIVDVPTHGSRRHIELFRNAENTLRVRFLNNDDQDVNVSAFAVLAAGKRHESDTAEIFDVSGSTVSGVSGAIDITIPLASGVETFEVPGVGEFRWYENGVVSGAPDGRHRMPLLIHRDIGK